jgi:hypothetical protein
MLVKETELYPAVSDWLNRQGYASIITGGKHLLSISMVSLLPGKIYLEPDVIGLKEPADLVAIEVKSDRRAILDGLGKCLAYTASADKVYLALTESVCQEIRTPTLFNHLKIGLLNIRFGKRIDTESRNRISTLEKEIANSRLKSAVERMEKMEELADEQDKAYEEDMRPEGWFVEEIVKPQSNYNVDFAGLHTELLRQTRAALGRS